MTENNREFVEPFDLAFLNEVQDLARWIEEQFHSPVTRVQKVGQGFYAQVFKATLMKDPYEVIVKCHLYAGRGAKERDQLEMLRRNALVKLPQVYLFHTANERLPCEALVMEVIAGTNAANITFSDPKTQSQFVDTVIENLKAWHAVTHPSGFGELGGPFSATWISHLSSRYSVYHQRIHLEKHRAVVSDRVMRIIDHSFEALPEIMRGAASTSSLVHSDYNAWNMMADPITGQLTGIIDPIDAGWCDREIDLFHLPNCRADLRLLDRYLEGMAVEDEFWMRFKFYRFWDDVKHYLRMGWYDETRFRQYGEALEQAMQDCL